jgi:S-(hydroxymethyl)glutathione dehydrogenase/alcohol dehydrogenase
MFGCMIPTGFGSVFNFFHGKTIRIFGVGGVGSAAILAAKCLSAEVYVVDTSVDKLLYAMRLGVDMLNLSHEKLSKVDVALDTTGNVNVIEQAFDSINDNGTLIIVGNGVGKISIDPFEFIKGKKIVGSWGGNCDLDIDINRFITVDTSKIKIITYRLDEINKAIEEFPKICGKVLLEC